MAVTARHPFFTELERHGTGYHDVRANAAAPEGGAIRVERRVLLVDAVLADERIRCRVSADEVRSWRRPHAPRISTAATLPLKRAPRKSNMPPSIGPKFAARRPQSWGCRLDRWWSHLTSRPSARLLLERPDSTAQANGTPNGAAALACGGYRGPSAAA
jgi:hypothetical protein